MRSLSQEIKAKRLSLGLQEQRVAQVVGLTLGSYDDLENYPDEWKSVTPIFHLRCLCSWFEINLLDFIERTPGDRLTKPAFCGEFVRDKRISLGLSPEDFADACGFSVDFTKIVEAGALAFLYPFEVSEILSRILRIDHRSFAEFCLIPAA